eukprot:2217752-Amphidinium_carterae.1
MGSLCAAPDLHKAHGQFLFLDLVLAFIMIHILPALSTTSHFLPPLQCRLLVIGVVPSLMQNSSFQLPWLRTPSGGDYSPPKI